MTLTPTYLAKRFEYDPNTGHIFWRDGERRAGKRAFTYKSARGYLVTTIRHPDGGTTLTAHRAAWALHHGEFPTGNIDHINGNRTDNRIINLRDVTNAENARNAALGKNNTSGVVGVYRHSQTGKWVSQINAFGRTVCLGSFTDFSDAVIARKAAERVLSYHENHGRN